MIDPRITVALSCAGLSGLGGIAATLRTNKISTKMEIFTNALNSALIGLAISLFMYQSFDDKYMIVGVSIIIGLMGSAGLEFILGLFTKKSGFSISIGNVDKSKNKFGLNMNAKDEGDKNEDE